MQNGRVVVCGAFFIVLVCLVVGASLTVKKSHAIEKNMVVDVSFDEVEKEMKSINNHLGFMIVQANATILDLQQRAIKSVDVNKNNYHDGRYEDAWIQEVDKTTGLARVITVDTKVDITFKPDADDLSKFHPGWIAPVTMTCQNQTGGECDFISPYNVYISNGLVKVKKWKFLRDQDQFKRATVDHAPGDKGANYPEGIMMDVKNGPKAFFIQGRLLDQKDASKISKIKRGDRIKVLLPENRPYRVNVNGAEMAIVAIIFYR